MPARVQPSVDAVLLDVDGTLVDSNDLHARSWADALQEHGSDISVEDVGPLIGMGGDRILPLLIGVEQDSPLGKAIDERRGEIFRTRYLRHVRGFRGVRELVERLRARGIRIAIASSAEPEVLEALLRAAGVPELARDAASSDDVERSKPSPGVVQVALQRVRVPPQRAVMIGDTPYDVAAATRAGVAIIAVRSGGWKADDLVGAIAIYDHVAEIVAQMDRPPLSGLFGARPEEWPASAPHA